ncbi:Hypothetical protein NG00_01449 [Corynebacterium camporealensis]|nr:Hypothetical protein NG00_01449 [Corynebacterium camporealensis]
MTSGLIRVILIGVTSVISNQGTTAPRAAALNRPNMVSVGTIVFLSQELMFFAGLFAMWFTSRANGQEGNWAEQTAHINLPMGFLITAILVSSSFTSQFGVFAAERGDVYKLRLWYSITIALGVVFLGIMAFEWYELIIHGVTVQASVFGSVFYIITGFHAAHVTAGLIAFAIILLALAKTKFTPAQATAAMAVSYYWHFVDVVWIGVFVVIYLIQ